MKALKDYEWEVQILQFGMSPVAYEWVITNVDCYISSERYWSTIGSAKRHFRKFAEVNKIKKWKFA